MSRREKALAELFKDKVTVRLDRDSTQGKGSLENYLEQINEMDLTFKLETLFKWLKDNKQNCENTPSKYTEQIYWGIKDICESIEMIMHVIECKIEVHNTKWLSYYRTIDLKDEILKLKRYNKVLD